MRMSKEPILSILFLANTEVIFFLTSANSVDEEYLLLGLSIVKSSFQISAVVLSSTKILIHIHTYDKITIILYKLCIKNIKIFVEDS